MWTSLKRSTSQYQVPRPSSKYRAPGASHSIPLGELLARTGRTALTSKQLDMLRDRNSPGSDAPIYYAGSLDLLEAQCVSIVGTRDASDRGTAHAGTLAKELAAAGVLVMSGLAKGIDTAALSSAIKHGGRTAAVIGTPLDKAYPAENAELQNTIWREHLLMSPFAVGNQVYRSNFPARNRVMAALSDVTVIIEASDTSGTLHQASECQRLGRWLFIAKAVADDPSLQWPARFIGQPKARVLTSTDELLDCISK